MAPRTSLLSTPQKRAILYVVALTIVAAIILISIRLSRHDDGHYALVSAKDIDKQ